MTINQIGRTSQIGAFFNVGVYYIHNNLSKLNARDGINITLYAYVVNYC